jgi:hypothetical protein
MRKIVNVIIGLVVLSFVFFNLLIVENKIDNTFDLSLDKLKIQLAHAAELPDVTITCSYGAPYDYCYKLTWKWCQNGNFFDYGCWATGNPSNSCSGFWT